MKMRKDEIHMHSKRLRILSLALAIALVVIIGTPARVEAVATTDTEITQQIKDTYAEGLRYAHRYSFDGYCGTYVSVQIYLLGISGRFIGGDGNQQFDNYAGMTQTEGGYPVSAYPASTYTLREALDEITQGGTKNVYNVVVGFQRSRSVIGQRCGHANVIHAILDGKVYFSESYPVTYFGNYYPEGAPIVWDIADYCEYYERSMAQFDGVIYFGLKTYADECTRYPASFTGEVEKEGKIYSQPCTPDVKASSKEIRTSVVGEQLTVTGLYQNTVEEFWYQIDNGEGGYILADYVKMGEMVTSDVQLTGLTAPTSLQQGRGYNINGNIIANASSINMVRVQVYQIQDEELIPAINATAEVNSKSYALKNSQISRELAFRSLQEGQYRIEISVILSNSYVENGDMQTRWDSIVLWLSDFQVTQSTTNTDTIMFDACGGTASLNQLSVTVGQAIGTLPTAQKLDYVFLGWYTDPDNGERVTSDYIPYDSTTLYARWRSIEQINASWQEAGECWYFYSDGISTVGCIEIEGVLYYFSTLDPINPGEMMWTAADTMS